MRAAAVLHRAEASDLFCDQRIAEITLTTGRFQVKGAENERSAREQLAACYHVFNMLGWTELIFNHITLRIPGTDHFLINPYGLWYDEITPDNLISVDT